jgi:hypothetical protein
MQMSHGLKSRLVALNREMHVIMSIIYLFAIATLGGVGAVLGGIIGFAVGFVRTVDRANQDMTAVTTMLPFNYALVGLVGGGCFGLLVGLIGMILKPDSVLRTADFVVRFISRIRRFRKP